jgi:nucleotide-binding universal stress UspA family protein
MKTIIAPTDFSPASLNAVNYAADLAVATGNNLLLIHIYQYPVIYGEVPIAVDQQLIDLDNEMRSLKEAIVKRTGGKIDVNTDINTSGTIMTEIESYCKSLQPSFVVMGSQGSSGIERLLFGSNTLTAIRRLSSPLIVVPPVASFHNMTKIGFACDFKDVVDTTPLDAVRQLVKTFNAELHVIHMQTGEKNKYSSELIEESGRLQEMIEEFRPAYHFLHSENIDAGLSEYADKNKLDLLIVIPKKHGLIDKMLHKSHARQLVVHTHVPVLSIHE